MLASRHSYTLMKREQHRARVTVKLFKILA